MNYKSKDQLITEFKKLLLEKKISQREVAQRLGVAPQGLTKILNKHNFSFDDMNKLLNAINCYMDIDFKTLD